MNKLKDHTLKEYLDCLSKKTPAPGGGSAAALVGATGAALISMVARYSLGKGQPKTVEMKIKNTLKKSEEIRKRLLKLVDLDAEAYLKVAATRKSNDRIKKAALKKAREVPLETCKLCYDAVDLTSLLAEKGNKYLISDVGVAIELLYAAYQSALINVHINQ